MDYNRRQRELEERIRSLYVRDDDVLKKVEKLLENQESQREFESRIEQRIEEIFKRQERMEEKIETKMKQTDEILARLVQIFKDEIKQSDIEITKKNTEILDVVETNLGWLDYFSEENEKLHKQISKIHGQIENTRKLERHLDLVVTEVSKSQQEIKANKEEIPKIIMEIRKETKHLKTISELKDEGQEIAASLESQKLDIEEVKRKMARKPKIVYKCYNSNCKTVLTKDLVLEEDGVSVVCPNIECEVKNIVEKLKEGYKWMSISCNDNRHYQQCPLNKKHRASAICLICGKGGNLHDESISAIISIENTETDAKNSIGASYFVKKALNDKEDSEKVNKCWNSNCNTVLPKNIAFREDGVSVRCLNSACRRYNIVGTLKEGNRWFWMSCNRNNHHQQFPLNTKNGENKKCQICGVEEPAFYTNAYTAIRE